MIPSLNRLATSFVAACVLVGCAQRGEQPTYTDGSSANGADARTASAKVAPAERAAQPHTSTASGRAAEDWTRGRLAFPTGNPDTSALLVEQAIPAEIMVGRPFIHEIKVTNISKNKLEDVEVSEAIPASFKLASEIPGSSQKDNVIRYRVGNLAAGESKSLRVQGAVAEAGSFNSCTSVSYNTALCMSTPVVSPALKLAKAVPQEIMVCDPLPIKLTVTNAGTGAARNVRIEDSMPAGMTTEDGRNAISFDVGTLNPGQSKDMTYNAKVSKTGRFESFAAARADNGLTAESAPVATIVRQPVLEVTKTGPDKLFLGRAVTYEITVTNKGDGVAANTVLTDAIPAGAKLESTTGAGRAASGGVQWNLGEIQPGAAKKVAITYTGTNAGVFRGQATAQAKCANAATAVAQTEFTGIPALLLECVDVTDPLEIGQDQTYVITVTNQGSAVGTNIKIHCNLEEAMQYTNSGGATRGRADGKSVVFDPLPSLAPKATAEWKVSVKAVNPGDVRFKIGMTADQLSRPVEETESSNFYK
jgi:uncharacterized repeat protein (TIGR01451 family)